MKPAMVTVHASDAAAAKEIGRLLDGFEMSQTREPIQIVGGKYIIFGEATREFIERNTSVLSNDAFVGALDSDEFLEEGVAEDVTPIPDWRPKWRPWADDLYQRLSLEHYLEIIQNSIYAAPPWAIAIRQLRAMGLGPYFRLYEEGPVLRLYETPDREVVVCEALDSGLAASSVPPGDEDTIGGEGWDIACSWPRDADRPMAVMFLSFSKAPWSWEHPGDLENDCRD